MSNPPDDAHSAQALLDQPRKIHTAPDFPALPLDIDTGLAVQVSKTPYTDYLEAKAIPTGSHLHLVTVWADIERDLLLAALDAPFGNSARHWLARAVSDMPGTALLDIGRHPEGLGEQIAKTLLVINGKIMSGETRLRSVRNFVERALDHASEAIRSAVPPAPSPTPSPSPAPQVHSASGGSEFRHQPKLGAAP